MRFTPFIYLSPSGVDLSIPSPNFPWIVGPWVGPPIQCAQSGVEEYYSYKYKTHSDYPLHTFHVGMGQGNKRSRWAPLVYGIGDSPYHHCPLIKFHSLKKVCKNNSMVLSIWMSATLGINCYLGGPKVWSIRMHHLMGPTIMCAPNQWKCVYT